MPACSAAGADIAIVAGESAYWDLIIKGAQEAADKYDADLIVVRAQPDLESQNAKIREVDSAQARRHRRQSHQSRRRGRAAVRDREQDALVTMDSDAPISKRLCFVGTDNYAAGRIVGQHVRLALGETGGEVVIAMSNLEKDNAIHRRQGVIDELLDRPFVPEQAMDPVDQVHKGQTFTIVATLLDNGDRERATQLATEALKSNPNVKCVIGLNAHNAPALVKSLQQAGKLGQIKIVGFDADPRRSTPSKPATSTPPSCRTSFGCGFQTVRILAENARGDTSGLPMFQRRTLPVGSP
jgi:ribose transport system substrate-binding protein